MSNELKEMPGKPIATQSATSSLLEELRTATYILTYKGRHKVENLFFAAPTKDEAIELSQSYCKERHLRWLGITPLIVDITEKLKEPKEN